MSNFHSRYQYETLGQEPVCHKAISRLDSCYVVNSNWFNGWSNNFTLVESISGHVLYTHSGDFLAFHFLLSIT